MGAHASSHTYGRRMRRLSYATHRTAQTWDAVWREVDEQCGLLPCCLYPSLYAPSVNDVLTLV